MLSNGMISDAVYEELIEEVDKSIARAHRAAEPSGKTEAAV
jgi:hypothetical protein